MLKPSLILILGLGFIGLLFYMHQPEYPSFPFVLQPQLYKHCVAISKEPVTLVENDKITVNFTSTLQIDGTLVSKRFMNDALLVVYSEILEQDLTYHAKIITPDTTQDVNIPGSLRFSRLGFNGHQIGYTRRMDKRLFRFVKNSTTYLDGPLKISNERLLAIQPLLDDRLFALEYNPQQKTEIHLSIYYLLDQVWQKHTIWNTTWSLLEDDIIPGDDLPYLYFLSTPVMAIQPDLKKIGFVFMKRLFELEYDPELQQRYKHNMYDIDGLGDSDFEISSLVYLEDGLAIVSESKRIIGVRKESSDSILDLSPFNLFLSLFFDVVLFGDLVSVMNTASSFTTTDYYKPFAVWMTENLSKQYSWFDDTFSTRNAVSKLMVDD
ncbi:hypothetical protein EDD86DRAFT_204021 [Gorgonomyces haynaldii]|nr:hypothetical protein EDD86DRAFT_204021 [Gorgonomyces haynaldii]